MIRSLAALGRSEGVELRYWSAWNEPNYRGFASPQRDSCAPGAPRWRPATTASWCVSCARRWPAPPAATRSCSASSPTRPCSGPRATSTVDFVRGLPQDVVCSTDLWAQHVYVGDGDTLPAVEAALAARGCPRPHHVWITETGVGGPRPGGPRPTDPASLRAQCRGMDGLLRRWYKDQRVKAVFQYSFREDALFPVGLVDPTLTRAYAPYELWRAWGGSLRPGAPPPALPGVCSG